MANTSKGRFPSYGLVRGPLHSEGGVPASVANGPDVELEGGEYIIPKEAVPDYLPVLQQITQVGRDRQQMQNGNSAIDALIASASMQNGIAQPKSPVYQEGGQVSSRNLKGARLVSQDIGRDDDMFTGQVIMAIPADQVGGEGGMRYYLSDPQRSDNMSMLSSQGQFDAMQKMAFAPQDSLPSDLVEGYFDRQNKKSPLGFLKNLIGKEQGGMVQYEDGGRVSVKSKLIDAMLESNDVSKEYSRADLETLDLDTLERLQSTMLERNIGDQYGGIEDVLVSKPGSADMGEKRTYANRFDVRQGFGPDGNTSTSREQLSVGSLPVLAAFANLASRAGVSGEGALGRVLNARLPIERITEDGKTSFGLSREQGGMIEYEDGGEVHSRRMYNQGTGFNKKKSDLDGDGNISEYERKRGMAIAKSMGNMQMGGMVNRQPMMQRPMNPAMNFSPMQQRNPRMYQDGGQVQPRKQQEMRNPNTFIGPPVNLMGPGLSDYEKAERNFEAFMDSLDRSQDINPFTGEPIDTDADIKRLKERMRQSKIPRSNQRMPMQEGGQVNVNSLMGKTVSAKDLGLKNLGEVTSFPPQFNMSRPEFEAILNYGNRSEGEGISQEEQMANFMSLLENEKRVRPVSPDRYIVKDGVMSETEMDVPKLTSAYMSSFGIATPLSRRQGQMLQRKMIAPETLNPQVKGLLNRVLVQRLAAEEN